MKVTVGHYNTFSSSFSLITYSSSFRNEGEDKNRVKKNCTVKPAPNAFEAS